MKKALLFSTAAAVVALPTLAGAQVSVSGPSGNVQVDFSHNEGVETVWTEDTNGNGVLDAGEDADGDGVIDASTASQYAYDRVADADHAEKTSMDLDWSMSGKNCCFSYGGFVGIKSEAGSGTGVVMLDDANIYIDMATAGRLEFGIDGDAKKGVFDRDYLSKGPLSGGLNVLNANAGIEDTFNGSAVSGTSVEYTNTIAGFSVAAAHDLAQNNWDLGAGYSLSLGGSSVDLAASVTSTDAVGVSAAASFGDYSVKVGYAEDDSDESSTYVGAATTFAGVGLSLEYVMNEAYVDVANSVADMSAESNELIAGASYSLAPGLTASASVALGEYEGDDNTSVVNTVADSSSGDITKMAVRLKLGF